MSWFKNADLKELEEVKKHFGLVANVGQPLFITDKRISAIRTAIGDIDDHQSIFFLTDGAWSNIDLIEYVLIKTGPAKLYFSSWAIASDSIRRIQAWQEQGLVQDTYAILDQGIRNRKPEIYQQAIGAFKNLKLLKCYAKVTIVANDKYSIILMGSANLTSNPRREVGIIIKDPYLVEHNIQWFMEEFADV